MSRFVIVPEQNGGHSVNADRIATLDWGKNGDTFFIYASIDSGGDHPLIKRYYFKSESVFNKVLMELNS